MANIHDYIKWRGDLPINDQFPFNELDNLVLARLSYMIYNKITMTQVANYKFTDYFKAGIILSIINVIEIIIFVPIIFPIS